MDHMDFSKLLSARAWLPYIFLHFQGSRSFEDQFRIFWAIKIKLALQGVIILVDRIVNFIDVIFKMISFVKEDYSIAYSYLALSHKNCYLGLKSNRKETAHKEWLQPSHLDFGRL